MSRLGANALGDDGGGPPTSQRIFVALHLKPVRGEAVPSEQVEITRPTAGSDASGLVVALPPVRRRSVDANQPAVVVVVVIVGGVEVDGLAGPPEVDVLEGPQDPELQQFVDAIARRSEATERIREAPDPRVGHR